MNKKGDLMDVMVFAITTFIFAIVLFVFIFVIPQITHGLEASGLNSTSQGATAITDVKNSLTNSINYGFLFLIFGMFIGILISSFFLTSHPIWIFLYILFLGITIVLTFYLGNIWQIVAHDPTLSASIADASYLNLIMGNIAEITMAVGALSLIIIFGKFAFNSGGGF